MWRTTLLPAILLASLVYLAGSLIVAPYGDRSYALLQAHKNRLSQNVLELRRLNQELRARAELLQRSADAVRLEARALGYYGESEEVLRFRGSEPARRAQTPGTIIRAPEDPPQRFLYVRLAALFSFLFTMLVGFFDRQEIRRASR